jgi:hypothetical protein
MFSGLHLVLLRRDHERRGTGLLERKTRFFHLDLLETVLNEYRHAKAL